MLEIPVSFTALDPALPIDESFSLDGRTFRLFIAYNLRSNRYFMDLYDGATGALLVGGVALVSRWFLLSRLGSSLLPDGDFIILSESGSKADPGLGELGTDGDFKLLYATAQELEEFSQ